MHTSVWVSVSSLICSILRKLVYSTWLIVGDQQVRIIIVTGLNSTQEKDQRQELRDLNEWNGILYLLHNNLWGSVNIEVIQISYLLILLNFSDANIWFIWLFSQFLCLFETFQIESIKPKYVEIEICGNRDMWK